MKIETIFEDQDILIVNKPAGLVVNEASSVKGETLQAWLTKRLDDAETADWQALIPDDFTEEFGTAEEIFSQRQGLVHRLDKDTSGVMITAKNPGALVNLLAQFKQRQVKKKYTCLTHRKFRVPKGTIDAPLARARVDRQKFAVSSAGRSAVTNYELIAYYPNLNELGQEKLAKYKKKLSLYQGFTLVKCWPKTGRTHQIRVHMKHWQHPLVGDSKYVGKRRAKLDELWCPRQFLHASQIEFTHPRTQKKLIFEAELAVDLQYSLSLLAKE